MRESAQNPEESLFEAALEKPSAAQRAAFLAEVTGDNRALRSRLELLLEGHFRGEGFLNDRPGGEAKVVRREPTAPVSREG